MVRRFRRRILENHRLLRRLRNKRERRQANESIAAAVEAEAVFQEELAAEISAYDQSQEEDYQMAVWEAQGLRHRLDRGGLLSAGINISSGYFAGEVLHIESDLCPVCGARQKEPMNTGDICPFCMFEEGVDDPSTYQIPDEETIRRFDAAITSLYGDGKEADGSEREEQ